MKPTVDNLLILFAILFGFFILFGIFELFGKNKSFAIEGMTGGDATAPTSTTTSMPTFDF